MKIEFSEDDVKQIVLEAARAMCPSVEWETVEIDAGYASIRKAVVTAKEAAREAQ